MRNPSVAIAAITAFVLCGCTAPKETTYGTSDIDAPESCGDATDVPERRKASRSPHNYRQGQLGSGQVDLTKRPVVIYYTVDSEEPYMQWAVDRDIRSLRVACELTRQPNKRQLVNWIAFVNSHLREHNSYLLCKAGELSEQAYESGFVTSGDTSEHELLRRYPLAEDQVLRRALGLVKSHFNPAEYVFNLHLKSHGNQDLGLTGLNQEQLSHKTDCQSDLLERQDVAEYSPISIGDAGVARSDEGVLSIRDEFAGHFSGLDPDDQFLDPDDQFLDPDDQFLDPDDQFLDQDDQFLDHDDIFQLDGDDIFLSADGITSLGVEEAASLGSSGQFGTTSSQLRNAIRSFSRGDGAGQFGFVMLESCNSFGGNAFDSHYESLAGFLFSGRVKTLYSAGGTLWYRNLDWKRIYARWFVSEAQTGESMHAILESDTADIEYWVQ